MAYSRNYRINACYFIVEFLLCQIITKEVPVEVEKVLSLCAAIIPRAVNLLLHRLCLETSQCK